MNHSKAVYVTLKDIQGKRGFVAYNNDRDNLAASYVMYRDFSCQCDNNRDNKLCTCKNTYRKESKYFSTLREVYRYTNSEAFTDVGIGKIKSVPRKRVRRIYLPDTEDRGVGSADLSLFKPRTWNNKVSYYEQKKTSSKCVGGIMEFNEVSVVSEKLSPISQTMSGSNSLKRQSKPTFIECKNSTNRFILPDKVVNMVISNNQGREDQSYVYNKGDIGKGLIISRTNYTHMEKSDKITSPIQSNIKPQYKVEVTDTKNFSSDSFVQHVYNLENPSILKRSNEWLQSKRERESITVIPPKKNSSKPSIVVEPFHDCKSTSMRKRLESLKRSFNKKVSKDYCNVINSSSHNNTPIKKDVSITSDPPSLEARSFTNIKKYSPVSTDLYKEEMSQITNTKPMNDVREKYQSSTDVMHGECQNVNDMFKLWGEKFKLDEDNSHKKTSVTMIDTTKKQKKKVELVLPKEENMENEKKEKKRFSFFKRKNKDKSKQTYKSKKGVTAGRCEVGEGLRINVGTFNEYPPNKKVEHIQDGFDDLLRNNWLKRCLDNRGDSRKSVNVRWNNDMYTTSSSTVFELMECIYKNNGIIFRSRSLTSEVNSSTAPSTSTGEYRRYRYYYKKPQVNFMQQTLQAWMIPTIITDNNIEKYMERRNSKYKHKKSIEVTFSNQKWFIDKSKAFSQKIKLVLNARNFIEDNRTEKSKYIVIDIPRGYFSGTSSEIEEQSQISNEQVYNIVEYDTVKSSSFVKIKSNDSKMDIGYHKSSDTVNFKGMDEESRVMETVTKTSSLHRDVVVQGSNVYVPIRCDVIGVGVITQLPHNRDLRDIRNTVLKMQEDINLNKISHTIVPQTKCDLAQSYIQDCYRRWIPLDVELYSWCISDPNLAASSDDISQNSHQNYGSKSCPNIYDEYKTSTILSSYETSSSSHYTVFRETMKSDDATTTYFNKFKKNSDDAKSLKSDGRRVMPKDSVEVFKRRKIYACSKNANKSISGKDAELSGCCTEGKCLKINGLDSKRKKKHVSLKDLDDSNRIGDGILSSYSIKKSEKCCTTAQDKPKSIIVPEPPSLDACTNKANVSQQCKTNDSESRPSSLPSNCPSLPNTPPPSLPTGPPQQVETDKFAPVQSQQKLETSNITLKNDKIKGNPPSRSPDCNKSNTSSVTSRSFCSRLIRSSSLRLRNKLSPPRKKSSTQSTRTCCCNKQPSRNSSKYSSKKNSPSPSTKSFTKSSKLTPETSASKFSTAFQRFAKKCNSCVIKKHSNIKNIETVKARSQPCCCTASNPKKTGIHLSKKPMPQIPHLNEPKCNVISLNSKDNAFKRNKSMSPRSCETIDARNIKVQDEDGNTLYERHEYRMDESETKNDLVTDMYRDSRIHGMSTSKTEIVLKNKNLETCESNLSLSNVVEINFNLKLKQGDKNAEIKMTKNITKDKQNENINIDENLKNVFVLEGRKNDTNDCIIDLDKGDLNIKIIINSYQQKASDSKHEINNVNVNTADEFTRKISEKFHTVSTGYSDVFDLKTYSIHRTTLNFSDSTETSNNIVEPCEELVNECLPEKSPRHSTDTDSIVRHTFDQSVSENNFENLHSKGLLSDVTNSCTSATDKDVQSFTDVQHSNMEISKARDKEEKKQILKQIFESPNQTKLPAKKLRGIRKLLRAVLSSDSSEHADVAKKLTRQSLKPKSVKESDGMTNYYQGSSKTNNKTSINKINQITYPTLTSNSTNTSGLNDNQNLECLCHLDTLNLDENDCKACCCGSIDKKDEEVDCDITQDVLTLDKSYYLDVETQDSYLKCKHKKSAETITSYVGVIKPQIKIKKRGKIFDKLPKNIFTSSGKAYAKKLKRQPVLGLSHDSKVVILNSIPNTLQNQDEPIGNVNTPIDILQLDETKKAVLDIYTERSPKKGHFVAKLPKFVYNKESQICNCYQAIIRDLIHANHSVSVL